MTETAKIKKTVLFTDSFTYDSPVIVTMESSDGNVCERFQEACRYAVADGYTGANSEIPDRYLKKAGLKKTSHDVVCIETDIIGKRKVTLCRCRQCGAYDEGTCFHYGGRADGLSTECDRIHGTSGHILIYGDTVVSEIPFDTDLEPKDAVEFIRKVSGDDELYRLREDIDGFLLDNFDVDDEADEKLWAFRDDC